MGRARYVGPMLLLLSLALAAPAPTAPETVSPPVTLGAFRAAFPAGTFIRLGMSEGGTRASEMHWLWTAVDTTGGTLRTTVYAADGTTVVAPAEESRAEWAELLAHANFPAAATTVTPGQTTEVVGGKFQTTLYTLSRPLPDGTPATTKFWFADHLPGPPVLMVVEAGGKEVSRMELLERSVRRAGLGVANDADAEALAALVLSRIGNPLAEPGLAFDFVVGSMRRTHRWDIPNGRAEVSWTQEGKACRATVPLGYTGDDPIARDAWAAFVNDQYWLLAPAKVADPGVVRTADGTDLRLFFEGVGLTPGDRYRFRTTPEGDVSGWDYVLQSGRSAAWTWSPPVAVGGLRLSLERVSGDRTIRFEHVVSAPQKLDEAPPACTPVPAP
jgi:hypothetical protein